MSLLASGTDSSPSPWELAARAFEPKPARQRRWASPLDMACALDPTIVRTPALNLINRKLVEIADRPGQGRLATFLSPQEGKSTLCSYWNPLWLLVDNPDRRVLIISYGDDIARRWGADIKLALETFDGTDGLPDLGLRLRADSKAAGRWMIEGHRGGVVCAGIGGQITGRPGDIICVDDPLKNLEEAQSAKYRDRGMRTWQGTLIPRMAPNTKVFWIQTLWHEDEPIQRILTNEGSDWEVIRIPAICDSADDPLGREIGEPMESARGQRDWAKIRRDVGEYVFAALFQQRPAPAEGGLFKRLWWRYWSPAPRLGMTSERVDLAGRVFNLGDSWRFATVDLAASTRSAADFTVACAWALTIDGDLVLLDRQRARIGEAEHFSLVRPLVERWGLDTVFVEASQHSMTLTADASRSGIPISPLRAETDKFSRALPASARASTGRVWLPAGASWLPEWLDETASFPNGSHDDQVDCLSYACRVAVTKWAPPPRPPLRVRETVPFTDPFAHSKPVDFMTVPL